MYRRQAGADQTGELVPVSEPHIAVMSDYLPDEIRREITRAAARPIEISLSRRPVCDAEFRDRLVKECRERDCEQREQAYASGLPDEA
jgi:hypothetical protein